MLQILFSMSDGLFHLLLWNVRGFSSKSRGTQKRTLFRRNLKKITPKPGIVFLQEHKMKQELCNKLGALGIRRGKGYWNGAILNTETNRWRGGTAILLSVALQHTVLDSGIAVEGKAQWVICNIENQKIGLLNVYAPNSGQGRASLWEQLTL